jgi:AAA domain
MSDLHEREAEFRARARANGQVDDHDLPPLRVVPLAEFAAQEEALAEALLGEDGDAALTPGGTAMVYGDGGAGKTTLLIDGVAHMAAGGEWLGMPVGRPLRVVVIENEGPRAPFRLKLRRKVETWEGRDFVHNVKVLEEPWSGFTFTNAQHVALLADACDEFEADLLAVGPLITVGVVGAGTPEEVAAFETVLAGFRRRLRHPLAVWFAHHENKAGDVSGAWERLPDTLLHVCHEDPKRTKIHWRKARWATSLHGQRWTLRWLEEQEGFERVEEAERDVPGEIRALWHNEPLRWRTVTEVKAPKYDGGIGRKREDVERALTALVDGGEFECEKGPEGRNANAVCYRPLFLARCSKQEKQDQPAPVAELVLHDPSPPVGRGGGARQDGRPGGGLAQDRNKSGCAVHPDGPHDGCRYCRRGTA